MVPDPVSRIHVRDITGSFYLFRHLTVWWSSPVAFTVCFCVYVCVSVCLSMYFCQFCFPVLTSGFLWCETLPHPA